MSCHIAQSLSLYYSEAINLINLKAGQKSKANQNLSKKMAAKAAI